MPVPVAGALWVMLMAVLRKAVSYVISYAGPVFAYALGWFGLQMVAYDVAIEPLTSQIAAALSGAPEVFMQVVGFSGLDRAMTMILSAYATVGAGRIMIKARQRGTGGP